MTKRQRMYDNTVTWNPFKGCRFDCVYCRPSFQRLAKLQKCKACQRYEPHEHPERLAKVPNGETIFVCSSGDISFASPEYMRQIIATIYENPRPRWYLQSKRPEYFEQFLHELPPNVVLVTTLETNRHEGYADISKAPLPGDRWREFSLLDWPRKAVTIEPMLDFDWVVMVEMILDIAPNHVWIGYNSRPHAAPLPEPPQTKVELLLEHLALEGIDVRAKDLRGFVIPERKCQA